MIYVLLTLLSLAPVVLLGYYIYQKDTVKEPKVLLLSLFIKGFLAAFLVVLFNILLVWYLPEYYLLDNKSQLSMVELFGLIFIEVALIEEFSKWIMIRLFGFNNKEFDQFFDIIVYSVFVSLGFAAVENIFYVVPTAEISTGVLRAMFSIPGHAAFGVYMGYFFARAKMMQGYNKTKYVLNIISALVVPTMFHTIYNFCLMIDNIVYSLIFLIFIILLYITSVVEINRASKSNTRVK